MTGAEEIAKALVEYGTKRVFSHAGGTISYILDAIHRAGIEVIVVRQEAQALHMAQGAFRVSGRAQVALVTSGPGVTNAVTGVADAYYDADAVVLICGQTSSLKGSRPVRQWSFQETPTVELMRPISKDTWMVEDPRESIVKAISLALAPRPGPVVLDVRMDVQK